MSAHYETGDRIGQAYRGVWRTGTVLSPGVVEWDPAEVQWLATEYGRAGGRIASFFDSDVRFIGTVS